MCNQIAPCEIFALRRFVGEFLALGMDRKLTKQSGTIKVLFMQSPGK